MKGFWFSRIEETTLIRLWHHDEKSNKDLLIVKRKLAAVEEKRFLGFVNFNVVVDWLTPTSENILPHGSIRNELTDDLACITKEHLYTSHKDKVQLLIETVVDVKVVIIRNGLKFIMLRVVVVEGSTIDCK